jgi:DNA-binding HxlR family transcriptional regulator
MHSVTLRHVRHDELDSVYCSVAQTWAVIGERWTMLLIREAFLGVRRYEDFCRRLGVSRNLLSDRLQLLVVEGVLSRLAYCEHPVRHEYRLTEKGMALYPVLLALGAWGDAYKVSEPPITYTHTACGNECHPHLVCDCCGEPIGPREIVARAEPDAFQRVPEKVC